MDFRKLKFYDLGHKLAHARVFFPNRYGASVFQGEGWGSDPDADTYNVVVLAALVERPRGTDDVEPLNFADLPLTGMDQNITREDVEHLLDQIAALPKRGLFGPENTVYVASAWWRDSDPSMGVVAMTRGEAEEDIAEQMRDAARNARDDGSYKSVDAALDDIAWSGIHAWRLGDIVSEDELEQAIADLESDGVFYPELP